MQHGMPWVKEVLLRLPEALQGQDLVDLMCFVSCIGILQNGDYISFDKLRVLLEDLPLSQARLRTLQVLSQFLLPQVYGIKLWSLHETIPYKVRVSATRPPTKSSVSERILSEPVAEEGAEDEFRSEEENVRRLIPRALPANCSIRWSSMDLALVNVNPEISHKEAYAQYMCQCQSRTIAFRTFNAFCRKRNHIVVWVATLTTENEENGDPRDVAHKQQDIPSHPRPYLREMFEIVGIKYDSW
ncbi:unnamed protein product [Leuciscus chuanchicus]